MLFLPKYGTIEVCALAALAAPPARSASRTINRTAETGAEESSGTRVRIGIYLKRLMTRKRARSYRCGERPANAVLGYRSGGRALAVLANRGRGRVRPEKRPGIRSTPVAETAPAPRLSSCGRAP